jgi:hypothetical protein
MKQALGLPSDYMALYPRKQYFSQAAIFLERFGGTTKHSLVLQHRGTLLTSFIETLRVSAQILY